MAKIMLQKFEMVLSGNKKAYQLGEQLTGKCIIGLEGELKLSKVLMKLKGTVEVKWCKSSVSTNAKIYKNKITFLAMDYDFVSNSLNGMITKGIHEFPFCIQLPKEGIPSSFVGFHGSVEYWIEAKIETPMFSLNPKTRTEFQLEAPLICDKIMFPLNGSIEKKLGYLYNSGTISVDINIDKRGYIPGLYL